MILTYHPYSHTGGVAIGMAMSFGTSVHFGPYLNTVSQQLWVGTKFGSEIHGSQMMILMTSDLLTCHLTSSAIFLLYLPILTLVLYVFPYVFLTLS